MITQGVIAAKSKLKIPVEPPDMPIPPKLPDPQDATTYSNVRATPEDTSNMPHYGIQLGPPAMFNDWR